MAVEKKNRQKSGRLEERSEKPLGERREREKKGAEYLKSPSKKTRTVNSEGKRQKGALSQIPEIMEGKTPA